MNPFFKEYKSEIKEEIPAMTYFFSEPSDAREILMGKSIRHNTDSMTFCQLWKPICLLPFKTENKK